MDLSHVQKVRLLYKTILKLHRGLPEELQYLGSNYVRDEFKRHKQCNVAEGVVFMGEWARYAVQLTNQLGLKGPLTAGKLGTPIGDNTLQEMRDEQVQQLYDLLLASKGERDFSQQKDEKVQ